jgi:hypothetical protein
MNKKIKINLKEIIPFSILCVAFLIVLYSDSLQNFEGLKAFMEFLLIGLPAFLFLLIVIANITMLVYLIYKVKNKRSKKNVS